MAGEVSSSEALIVLRGVAKDYESGESVVHALRDVDLTFARGEFVAIVGTSGSGKSTLMNILGCLDRPTRGTYELGGLDVGARTNDGRAIVRNRLIGFIFQGFNLLPRTTALENVELPLQYRGVARKTRRARAQKALEEVGLGDRMGHTPNQLSGGQQQRVAIARALVTDPPLLLADEPTGNLDTRTSLEVLALLQKLNREQNITIALVTHEHDIAACASRVITFRDGRMVSDVTQSEPMDALAELGKLAAPEARAAGPEEEHLDEARQERRGGPLPARLFLYMLLAAAGGLAAGQVYNKVVLEKDVRAIPLVFALVAAAWVGARAGRRVVGRPLTRDQRLRGALYFSAAVLVLQGVLALIAMPKPLEEAVRTGGPLVALRFAGAACAMTLVASLVLYGLVTLFFPEEIGVASLFMNAVRLALTAIVRQKTRSALTVLGILIGVAAVVTVTALADGASAKVGGEISGFASNGLFISPQPVQQSGARSKALGRLTEADGRAISREAVSVNNVAPFLSTAVQMVYGDHNAATLAVGTTLSYFPIRKYKVEKGEAWTESDELLKTKVCVIGATVAEKLFGTEDAVGRVVRIKTSPYRVIGVLEARGTSTFGDDQDDRILMPIGSYRARMQRTSPGRVDMLLASAATEEVTFRAKGQVEEILRQRHGIKEGAEPDFVVNTQREFQKAQEGIAMVLSALLLGVAAVSLLVGGIGVMNIMLVSVAERTREIGIRMSIGAREGDILLQFLVEAIVLSLIGGALGIVAGTTSVLGLGYALGWEIVPGSKPIAIAVATSGAIGVVFGFFPARRAARLDPIEALRTE